MPQRCSDVFAWWRLFMGPAGPAPITRLVLSAHVLFMDRDGSNCRVGVRRLAQVTGLNKSTVAEHRSHAIEAGWLIASSCSSRSVKREIVAATPDTIAMEQLKKLSGEIGQLLSGAAEQLQANSPLQLYGQDDSTVRFQPSNCPAPPDIPLIPLLPLRETRLKVDLSSDAQRTLVNQKAMRSLLEDWVRNNQRAHLYWHDPAALALLVPPKFRFPGYEDFIQRTIADLRRPK